MVDGLNGLRHNTVVRCDNENRDICCLGTTHTHCRERLMTRCIEECDLLSVVFNNIGTDVLCDTACLSGGYICLADRVKKGSFTVVNMTHYADDRRSRNHVLLVLFFLFQEFLNDVDLLLLLAENIILHCDLFGFLEVDLLIDRNDRTL